jgi:hypothetical protein
MFQHNFCIVHKPVHSDIIVILVWYNHAVSYIASVIKRTCSMCGKILRGDTKVFGVKNCPSATSNTINQTQTVLGLNPGLRNEKQSLYRPGQSLRVPEGWGSQTSKQSGHECCQPYAPAAFTPKKCSWYSFLLEAEWTTGPEGLCQWKILMHKSGIEPATFRLVAQCLN